jgi:excisionase family DNA binding protein
MGYSQLKIPRICEYCSKPFEAKTVSTRFCSKKCGKKSGKEIKKQAIEDERKQQILKESAASIAKIQTRPYISIAEAVILYGISKNTIHRLIKSGRIPGINLGERFTRISRVHIEAMFPAIELPEESQEQSAKMIYEPNKCYTIAEVSAKFGVSLSTVNKTIHRFGIPRRRWENLYMFPKNKSTRFFANKQ